MEKLLTTEDFAQLMGWSVGTVYQRRYRGLSLPRAIEIGTGKSKAIRFRPEDVDEWLAEHTKDATDAFSSNV